MQLTSEQINFLTGDSILAERMRYLIAALQGYKVPWMLAEVLLQSNDQERQLWQQLENLFVYSKKSFEPFAKQTNVILNQLATQGWLEYRIESARTDGVNFARSISPVRLIEDGQRLQFSENPYNKVTRPGGLAEEVEPEIIEAWREGFHSYLCFIREESW
ncbi:hypothetical protein THMIRHAM_21350 [Thiomicrorhabdus immobilis]|uniref:Uncharacterized protein n=1 Tax=Thiomicrorhabdus immobilis TaxID=2791037 RepID=A0ABN6D2J4_9GAMM|nr:hypothetical protein [Thiomicrorhabdus immobilis]BCN94350.1 hypothetical protein THMIRHAM_21350 [Thiomicrorhabdus immobilis]